MEKFETKIFDIEVGDKAYSIEFNRETLKLADEMGAMNNDKGLFERATILLYAGLKKNKPDITYNLSKKILDSMVGTDDEDGEYDLTEILNSIGDEFGRCYTHFFAEGGAKKKKILSRAETFSPKTTK
ncbi:MAG: hypothetical protein RR708_04360 [Bacilli bacterium]